MERRDQRLRTKSSDNVVELVNVRVTGEQRVARKHFCKQAATRPHVDGLGLEGRGRERERKKKMEMRLGDEVGRAAAGEPQQRVINTNHAVVGVANKKLRGAVPACGNVVRVDFAGASWRGTSQQWGELGRGGGGTSRREAAQS